MATKHSEVDLSPAIKIVEAVCGKGQKKGVTRVLSWDVDGVEIKVDSRPTKKPKFGFSSEYVAAILIGDVRIGGQSYRARQTIKLTQKDPKAAFEKGLAAARKATQEAQDHYQKRLAREDAKGVLAGRLQAALGKVGLKVTAHPSHIGTSVLIGDEDAEALIKLLEGLS